MLNFAAKLMKQQSLNTGDDTSKMGQLEDAGREGRGGHCFGGKLSQYISHANGWLPCFPVYVATLFKLENLCTFQ